MKRAIIADDGETVENVIILSDDDDPHPDMPAGIDLGDDAYVGPGMIWNGDLAEPEFTAPRP